MFNLNSIIDSSVIRELIMSFVNGIPKIIMAIVILIIGSIIAKIIRNIIKKVLVKINIDKIGEKLNEIEFVEVIEVNKHEY